MKGIGERYGGFYFSKAHWSFVPRNKYLAVIAVAALAISVVELVDRFNLPFESSVAGGLASGGLFSMDLVYVSPQHRIRRACSS